MGRAYRRQTDRVGGPPPPVVEKSTWIRRDRLFEAHKRQCRDLDRRRCHRPGMIRNRFTMRLDSAYTSQKHGRPTHSVPAITHDGKSRENIVSIRQKTYIAKISLLARGGVMASLSPRDLERVEEFLRGLYARRRVEPLIWYVLEELPKLIGTHQVCWNNVVPALQQADVMAWPPEAEHEAYQSALERHLREHPLVRHFSATGDLKVLKISDFLSARAYHNTTLYDEMYRHLRYEDQFAVHLRPLGPQWSTVTVARDCRSFTERDRLLLNLLRPHIAQAFRQSRAMARLARRTEARRVRPATSRIQLDRDEYIAQYPARAQRWIAQYFDDLPSAPRRLPDSVQRWLVLAQRIQAGELPEHAATPLVTRRFGRMLMIYLAAHDEQSGTELVLEERTDLEATESRGDLPLTRRELQVLLAVEQGKRNDEIAAELEMRPRTVKKHLEHIFEMLDVHNRTAAVARLHRLRDV